MFDKPASYAPCRNTPHLAFTSSECLPSLQLLRLSSTQLSYASDLRLHPAPPSQLVDMLVSLASWYTIVSCLLNLTAQAQNAACYYAAGQRLSDDFMPCGDPATGYKTCCQATSNCMKGSTCFISGPNNDCTWTRAHVTTRKLILFQT